MKYKKSSLLLRFFFLWSFCAFLIFAPNPANSQTSWQPVNSNILNPATASPLSLVAASKVDSTLYAVSGTNVYAWLGRGWALLGNGPTVPGGQAGNINAIVTDAAGNVYVAGFITDAQGNYCVAKWNGHQWSEVGTGAAALNPNSSISVLAVDSKGNIYATGHFTNSKAQFYIAKWDGNKWSELGTTSSYLNANNEIYSMTTDAAGNVYAAGSLTDANNNLYIAKWNGTKWADIGGGIPKTSEYSNIQAIAVSANGYVYASGIIANSEGYVYVAEWSGSAWSQLPVIPSSHLPLEYIAGLTVDASGNLLVAGYFLDNLDYDFVPMWNGSSWSNLGAGAGFLKANNAITAVTTDMAGNVYTCGKYTDSAQYSYVAKWTKSIDSWSELGIDGTGELKTGWTTQYAVATPNNIYADLRYFYEGEFLAHWNGYYWTGMNVPSNILVPYYIAADAKGNLYGLNSYNDTPYVVKWDGQAWSRLDTIGGFSTQLISRKIYDFSSFVVSPEGTIYANEDINGPYQGAVAKFDGTSWSEINYVPTQFEFYHGAVIDYIAVGADDTLYATLLDGLSGYYFVAKWDGSQWVSVGSSVGFINYESSNIYVGSSKNICIGIQGYNKATYSLFYGVARWDGQTWKTWDITNTGQIVTAVAADNKGNAYYGTGIGGGENPGKYQVYASADTGWVPLGTPPLNPNNSVNWFGFDIYGNLYASGDFTDSVGNQYLARYGSNNTLPVKIINFTGYVNKNNAVLNWQTSQEINTKYFNVERSTDGVHFTVIGKVDAAGNSSNVQNYSYADNIASLDTSLPKIYYRLVEIDDDGNSTYTNVVQLNLYKYTTAWSAKIYPVPAKNWLQLALMNCVGKTMIIVYDELGAKVLEQHVTSAYGVTQVNISSLTSGAYFLKVFNNGESKTLKFIKN